MSRKCPLCEKPYHAKKVFNMTEINLKGKRFSINGYNSGCIVAHTPKNRTRKLVVFLHK